MERPRLPHAGPWEADRAAPLLHHDAPVPRRAHPVRRRVALERVARSDPLVHVPRAEPEVEGTRARRIRARGERRVERDPPRSVPPNPRGQVVAGGTRVPGLRLDPPPSDRVAEAVGPQDGGLRRLPAKAGPEALEQRHHGLTHRRRSANEPPVVPHHQPIRRPRVGPGLGAALRGRRGEGPVGFEEGARRASDPAEVRAPGRLAGARGQQHEGGGGRRKQTGSVQEAPALAEVVGGSASLPSILVPHPKAVAGGAIPAPGPERVRHTMPRDPTGVGSSSSAVHGSRVAAKGRSSRRTPRASAIARRRRNLAKRPGRVRLLPDRSGRREDGLGIRRC